jgi:hypothetical protein
VTNTELADALDRDAEYPSVDGYHAVRLRLAASRLRALTAAAEAVMRDIDAVDWCPTCALRGHNMKHNQSADALRKALGRTE